MAEFASRSDGTLGEWLTAHACAVRLRRLRLDIVGGGTVVLAAGLWRVRGWPAFAAGGLCFVAFGVWAIAARHLAARPIGAAPRALEAAWRGARAVAALVGTLVGAVLLAFTLLFGVLGTWIS